MEDLVPIGEAARRAGLNASALRYYEQRGILAPAARRGATRMYGPDQLRRLAFIQAGRRLGMSLEDIAGFLHGPPHQWRGIVRARIAALEEQIRQAEQARDYLGHALQCPSEHPVDQCPHLRAILDSQLAAPERTS
jgi:DNA-binding transcriptional MerR regulator